MTLTILQKNIIRKMNFIWHWLDRDLKKKVLYSWMKNNVTHKDYIAIKEYLENHGPIPVKHRLIMHDWTLSDEFYLNEWVFNG